jgi:hypothetical protein
MKKHKFLFAGILFLFMLGVTGLAAAQDSPRKDDGGARVQGKAGDHSFDVQVQGGESRRDSRPSRESPVDNSRPGPQGGKENPDLKVPQDPQVRPAGRYWAWIPLWRFSSGWLFSQS